MEIMCMQEYGGEIGAATLAVNDDFYHTFPFLVVSTVDVFASYMQVINIFWI